MPFPTTWNEELLAEWLTLEGYFVDVGVPVCSGSRGGRFEADVIGVKAKDGKFEIFHVEVGSLSGNPKENAVVVRDKFSKKHEDAIKDCYSKKLNVPQMELRYKPLYVAVWGAQKTIDYLEAEKLPVKELTEVIEQDILPAIKRWKDNPPFKTKTTGKNMTLPQNMWLLYLVNYLLE
jgi:hypothetical protein